MEFKSKKQLKDEGYKTPLRIWLVGQAGSGKTAQAAFLANAGFKTYLIDMNGESHTCLDDFLTEKGEENIIPIHLYPENLDKKGKKAHEGSLSDKLEQTLIAMREQNLLDDPDTFIVIDGITDWSRDLMRLSYTTNKSGEEDKRVSYGVAQAEFLRQYMLLMTYTKNCSLVVIGHLKEVSVDGGVSQPAVESVTKAFSADLLNSAGLANLFVTEKSVEKGTNKRSYDLITRPTYKKPFVKNSLTSMGEIPDVIESKDFLPRFVKAYRTGKWE